MTRTTAVICGGLLGWIIGGLLVLEGGVCWTALPGSLGTPLRAR